MTKEFTVKLTVEQCQGVLDDSWYEPKDYVAPNNQAYAALAVAIRNQWTPPSEPQVGDVVRFLDTNITRFVRAVDDSYVYMSPSLDDLTDGPIVCTFTSFYETYEVVSDD